MAEVDLTAQRLREVVHYSAETGVFTRTVRLAQRHHVGDRADFLVTGGGAKGYRRVSVDSMRFLAHRAAWLYLHGTWPVDEIDHINGDRGDNRIANLRCVPRGVNAENIRRPRADNTSGFLGVYWHKQNKKWCARVTVKGRAYYVGFSASAEEAHCAYVEAKRRLHEGCTL